MSTAIGNLEMETALLGCVLCLPAILRLTRERGAGSAGAPRVRSSLGCGLLAEMPLADGPSQQQGPCEW